MQRQLIEMAREKLGTYRAVADFLETTEGTLSAARRGKVRNLTPSQAGRLAELVGADVMAAIADAHILSARSEADKEFWLKKKEQRKAALGSVFGPITTAAAAVILALGAAFPTLSESGGSHSAITDHCIHYPHWRRLLRAALRTIARVATAGRWPAASTDHCDRPAYCAG